MNNNPKRLYKIEDGKKICGVCGGLAEYLNLDPTLVRIVWLVLALGYGISVLIYIVCAICMPNKSEVIK